MEGDESGFQRLAPADVAFLASHPSLASRRLHFDISELTTMILEVLSKRGLPASVVAQSRWVWAKSSSGNPELILILPGAQA